MSEDTYREWTARMFASLMGVPAMMLLMACAWRGDAVGVVFSAGGVMLAHVWFMMLNLKRRR